MRYWFWRWGEHRYRIAASMWLVTLVTLLAVLGASGGRLRRAPPRKVARILVFSQTAAFRHDSIPVAIPPSSGLGAQNGFSVDATEDPQVFAESQLATYRAVVFPVHDWQILDNNQRAAFQRYIEAGNGFVGVHSASDTGYDWPWYGGLVGHTFRQSFRISRRPMLHVEDATHPSTADLPSTWPRTDEWYVSANPRDVPGIHVAGRR